MPLKDLVARKSEITEAAIEAIVSKYVRYYTDSFDIGFTPEGVKLGNENKLLVYLVAAMGWRYVTDDVIETPTKPSDLEKALGIAGGTLRPLLKSLKDKHLIAPVANGYSVREGNLEAISAIVGGSKTPKPKISQQSQPKNREQKARRSTANSITSTIESWVAEGFFESSQTLRAVHARLHEEGVITPQTSVSGPLLRLVQQRRLRRQKIVEDDKEVWAYRLSKV